MNNFKAQIYKTQTGIAGAINDTVVPSVPTGLLLDYNANGLILFWVASTDNVAVDYYEIWRSFNGGTYVAPIGSSSTSPYEDLYLGLADGNYTYKVLSVDTSGNKSVLSTQSNTLSVVNGAQPI